MNTAESRLAKSFFVVEATSFEKLSLWSKYCKNSIDKDRYKNLNWEQLHDGWLVTVGHDNKRPVCISVSWFKIEGYLVMFYEATSQVVNHQKIDEWIKKHFNGKWDGSRSARCDANNFHLCIQAIMEQKKLDSEG